MKIVIGGATSAGRSIVGYLSLGNNDIVVVDENAQKLDELAKEYDIQPVTGSISHPDVQESVGMKNADMLIAVTDSDEVNLIACQVAYTLFNVAQKIARVDSKYFLNPMWNTLYNEKSLPVDLLITPDVEIGEYILRLISLAGSTAVYPFENNKINLFSFVNKIADSPFSKFSVEHINNKLAELEAKIVMIIRGNNRIINEYAETYLQKNDLIYIICPTAKNTDILHVFEVDHNPYENVVIFGANAISHYIASNLEKDDNLIGCNIIDDNINQAEKLADSLNNSTVISGEIMSDVILDESGFNTADISIAVTDKDKDNLLISLLASKNKDTQALSLVNSKDYNVLARNIRNNTVIDRSVVTISSILRHLRKARIDEAYALGREMGEVWEIRLGEDSQNTNKKINELNLPQTSSILGIINKNHLITNLSDYVLSAEDKIVIYVSISDIRKIEDIFYR